MQHPLELGKLLLRNDQNPVDASTLDRSLAKGETATLQLKKPVPVILFYWTDHFKEGNVRFEPDLYQRDRLVLEALNGPP